MFKKALLLSIHPIHAEKLLKGVKHVELRRVKPKLNPGDLVVVYVSSPAKEIRGLLKVEKVVEKSPQQLWTQVRDDACVSKIEFDEYYSGVDRAFGIYVHSPSSIRKPISLNELRSIWKNFHPPQSYRYLSLKELGQAKII